MPVAAKRLTIPGVVDSSEKGRGPFFALLLSAALFLYMDLSDLLFAFCFLCGEDVTEDVGLPVSDCQARLCRELKIQ